MLARFTPSRRPALLSLVLLSACATPPTEPAADQSSVATPSALIAPVTALSADALVESIGLNTRITNVGTVYGTRWDAVVRPRLLEIGVRHLRDAGMTMRNDGWMKTVYGRMRDLASKGIKFDLVMFPAEGAPDSSSIYNWDRFLSYAGPAIEAFEGLNEWDLRGRSLTWPAKVEAYQKALWAKVKADSRIHLIPIYGPSMGHATNGASVANLSPWLNYGNMHPYPGGNPPSRFLNYSIEWMGAISTGRRWVVTETGYHNALQWPLDHPAVSEYAASHYIPRLFLEYFSAGYPRTYLQELIDQGPDNIVNRESSFGLLRNDGTPKPAYPAVKNLISLLSDKGPAFTPGQLAYTIWGDTTNLKTILLQKRNGVFYLGLWQGASAYDLIAKKDIIQALRGVHVTFAAPVRQTRLFTPVVSPSATALKLNTTEVFVGVPDHPVFLEITP